MRLILQVKVLAFCFLYQKGANELRYWYNKTETCWVIGEGDTVLLSTNGLTNEDWSMAQKTCAALNDKDARDKRKR